MLWALVLSCAKTPNTAMWEETPRLPSPMSATYARVPAKPPDPGVAEVLAGRAWDASLGGTAAGLALAIVNERGSITPPEVREAAWRAGWPYPVAEVRAWSSQAGKPPPPDVAQWVAAYPEPAAIGLVRARRGSDDMWIGVASKPAIELGAVPRSLPKGDKLLLPSVPGVTANVADPVGTLLHVTLDTPWSTAVQVDGEWLIELMKDGTVLARFPIYVGLAPPEHTLLVPSHPPQDEQDADDLAIASLADVRDAYGLPPFERDPLLDAMARTVLATPKVSTATLASRVGIPAEDLWKFNCRGSTVETCIDSVMWRSDARPGFLAPRALFGLTAAVSPSGVDLALVVAREPAIE